MSEFCNVDPKIRLINHIFTEPGVARHLINRFLPFLSR